MVPASDYSCCERARRRLLEEGRSVDAAIRVPTWVDLEVGGTSLDLSVRGLAGAIRVVNVSGDVLVQDAAGTVDVRSSRGAIQVTNARGGVRASSQADDVTLRRVSGPVEAHSGDGDIVLDAIESRSVRAEAQDGSGLNNANFFTPADGQRPRMQMFVWRANVELTVDSPAEIAGPKVATSAGFGPVFPSDGLTNEVVLALDEANPAGPSTTDGCTVITNPSEVDGKIALVDRGGCEFSTKAVMVQNAGAVAMIVANNQPGAPISMGACALASQVTIPSTMIGLDDGNEVKAHLEAPVAVTTRAAGVDRDSYPDAGVIAHEYGQGISNRLTGGRTVVNCLNNQERMGEGWSDWTALVLTRRPGDTRTTPRGIGTYLIFQERHELDVNILMFCLWLAASGRGQLNDVAPDPEEG